MKSAANVLGIDRACFGNIVRAADDRSAVREHSDRVFVDFEAEQKAILSHAADAL